MKKKSQTPKNPKKSKPFYKGDYLDRIQGGILLII